MNEMTRYMQETGIGARDFSELDEYEGYLYNKAKYGFQGATLSRDEWESMASQYDILLNDIRMKRQQAPVITWDIGSGIWEEIEKLENLADDLERQLWW